MDCLVNLLLKTENGYFELKIIYNVSYQGQDLGGGRNGHS